MLRIFTSIFLIIISIFVYRYQFEHQYKILEIENLKNGGQEIIIQDKIGQTKIINYSNDNFVKTLDSAKNDLVLVEDNQIVDTSRIASLIVLFILFLIISITIAGKNAIFSVISMSVSFLIIFNFILPNILDKQDPLSVAITGSLLIIPVTFYLSHGFNKKTHIAALSTIITLIITGLLAKLAINFTALNGLASEESLFLITELQGGINLKGLLLSGIIISTLGILDDITISQVSVVNELIHTNSKLSYQNLFIKAMKVGVDHIASLINTLVLVYAGSSLPLLILFINSNKTYADILNLESVATEIVKTIIGSTGLVMAVPIATAIACYAYTSKK